MRNEILPQKWNCPNMAIQKGYVSVCEISCFHDSKHEDDSLLDEKVNATCSNIENMIWDICLVLKKLEL
jgi:hypothetical protein